MNEQDLTQRLKAQLTLFSVDEIERRIKSLEQTQQTSSLSIKEDKKIMEEIKRLSSNKPMIRQYDEAQVLAPLPMFFFVFPCWLTYVTTCGAIRAGELERRARPSQYSVQPAES